MEEGLPRRRVWRRAYPGGERTKEEGKEDGLHRRRAYRGGGLQDRAGSCLVQFRDSFVGRPAVSSGEATRRVGPLLSCPVVSPYCQQQTGSHQHPEIEAVLIVC